MEDLDPNFNLSRWAAEQDKADEAVGAQPFRGFSEVSVKIDIPSGDKSVDPQPFYVPGLYCRKLTTLIEDAFAQPLADKFHFTPFRQYRDIPSPPNTSAEDEMYFERIHGELYTSEDFVTEHDRVQRLDLHPDDKDCKLERVVAALMFWSDATHLADFGTAKLWPIYMFFGNLSKYERAKPTSGACHHLAYIPSLPDSFQDAAKTAHAKWSTQKQSITAHCRRDLLHAVWTYLLDNDFVRAYKFGMVIKCRDGTMRRVYPRIFTYSADYPEKVMLACIRDMGVCPCPRCLTTKDKMDLMGQAHDMHRRTTRIRKYARDLVHLARKYIYKSGFGIRSSAVEDHLLKETSLVPTL
ncbi:hypothetical protein FISHEDRAFT_35026, partial [Fistulina hepatica ATCC 64428]